MNARLTTSTQIRNFYSNDISYVNVKFFNINLAFHFYAFTGKDDSGRSTYDKTGQSTTVSYDAAYALYKLANDIVSEKVIEANLQIQCLGNASLTLERKQVGTVFETWLTINKNGVTIPFKFQTQTYQIKENNNIITRTIESQLGAFAKTLEGYLTGINADRHLNKLTDDYVKTQGNGNQNNNQQNQSNQNNQRNYPQQQQNNGYRSNNGWQKKPYNNKGYNGGWKKPYNPQQNQQPQPQWNNQNMSSYSLPN